MRKCTSCSAAAAAAAAADAVASAATASSALTGTMLCMWSRARERGVQLRPGATVWAAGKVVEHRPVRPLLQPVPSLLKRGVAAAFS
jgi:hypothetical protein